jgi:DNA-binding transcriptional MerR regulator
MSNVFREVGKPMQIRDVSEQLGLTVDSIRYFEREGLVDPPARSANGYRSYSPKHIERLRFIANCRSLEMSHDEIRQLIDAEKSPRTERETVANVVRHHIDHVRSRIATLRELLRVLKSVDDLCTHDANVRACDVMRALAAPMRKRVKSRATHV